MALTISVVDPDFGLSRIHRTNVGKSSSFNTCKARSDNSVTVICREKSGSASDLGDNEADSFDL